MSRELETPLRKSLDSFDAFRRRITIVGWIVAASTFGAFYWLSHVTRTSDDPKRLLNAAVLAIALLIAMQHFCFSRMHDSDDQANSSRDRNCFTIAKGVDATVQVRIQSSLSQTCLAAHLSVI